MPIYEYRCSDCNVYFEKIMSSSSIGQKINCTACNSQNVTKAITAANYRLSGNRESAPLGSMSRCASKPGFS